MDRLWVLFILLFAILKGVREGMKKAALKKSSIYEILFFYTLIGLILVLPFSASAFSLAPVYIFWAFVKAAVVCTAWLCTMWALKTMAVSLYGIVDLSRMVFSTLLGVFVLGETLTLPKIVGMLLVVTGLLLVNFKKDSDNKGATLPVLCAALLNSALNSVSGTMDKILMQHMDSAQLQFWFMLFMTLIYGAILLIRKEKIAVKHLKTNYWIPLMSLALIIGDRFGFEANASPYSQVTLMTIIRQSSVIVTVLIGWIAFKEKHILYKLLCCAIVLAGIFIAVFL